MPYHASFSQIVIVFTFSRMKNAGIGRRQQKKTSKKNDILLYFANAMRHFRVFIITRDESESRNSQLLLIAINKVFI